MKNAFQSLNQEEEIQRVPSNDKVQETTSKEWVMKSFGAMLQTHGTNQSSSPTKQIFIAKLRCTNTKQNKGRTKKYLVEEKLAEMTVRLTI